MKFYFKAKNAAGKEIDGEREANDRLALAHELRTEGLTPIVVKPIKGSKWWQISFGSGRVAIKEKIVFAGNLSAMISAGLSLARALSVIERQSSSKTFRQVIASLSTKIREGQSFSAALAAYPKVFPPVFTAMVSAGEESGKLPQALDTVSDQMMKSYDLRRKVRGAMIYPIIIIIAIIAIGALMMIFLVPNLVSIFQELDTELPLTTRIVIWVSNFLSQHTLTFLLVVLLSVVGLTTFFRTAKGKRTSSWLVVHLPLISPIAKEFNSATSMRTLASLVASGVGMVTALNITEKVVQNDYYKTVLTAASAGVEKGQPLSTVFRENEFLYPPLVGELVEVGEETGKLSEMLVKGATFYEDEVNQATKNLSTIIEPLLMVVIGFAVGFFAVSMIGPIYSLSEAL